MFDIMDILSNESLKAFFKSYQTPVENCRVYHPFAYFNVTKSLFSYIDESSIPIAEKELAKAELTARQQAYCEQQASACLAVHPSRIPSNPVVTTALLAELQSIEVSPDQTILEKIIKWLNQYGYLRAAERLTVNPYLKTLDSGTKAIIIDALQQFCARLPKDRDACPLEEHDFIDFDKCAEGFHDSLNNLTARLSDRKNYPIFEAMLRQAIFQVIIPLYKRFEIKLVMQSHIDFSNIYAYMGIQPKDEYRSDSYRLKFSVAYLHAIARSAMHIFHETLLNKLKNIKNLISVMGHKIECKPEVITHFNLLIRELKEIGYDFPDMSHHNHLLEVLTGHNQTECEEWLIKAASPEELCDTETQAIKSTLAIYPDSLNKAVDKCFSILLSIDQSDTPLAGAGGPATVECHNTHREFIRSFLINNSWDQATKDRWEKTLNAPDGLHLIIAESERLEDYKTITAEAILYRSSTSKSLLQNIITDPIIAERYTGHAYDVTTSTQASHSIKRDTLKLAHCFHSLHPLDPHNTEFQKQISESTHEAGSCNFHFGLIASKLTETPSDRDFMRFTMFKTYLRDNLFYQFSNYSSLLRSMLQSSRNQLATQTITKTIQELVDTQYKHNQIISYLRTKNEVLGETLTEADYTQLSTALIEQHEHLTTGNLQWFHDIIYIKGIYNPPIEKVITYFMENKVKLAQGNARLEKYFERICIVGNAARSGYIKQINTSRQLKQIQLITNEHSQESINKERNAFFTTLVLKLEDHKMITPETDESLTLGTIILYQRVLLLEKEAVKEKISALTNFSIKTLSSAADFSTLQSQLNDIDLSIENATCIGLSLLDYFSNADSQISKFESLKPLTALMKKYPDVIEIIISDELKPALIDLFMATKDTQSCRLIFNLLYEILNRKIDFSKGMVVEGLLNKLFTITDNNENPLSLTKHIYALAKILTSNPGATKSIDKCFQTYPMALLKRSSNNTDPINITCIIERLIKEQPGLIRAYIDSDLISILLKFIQNPSDMLMSKNTCILLCNVVLNDTASIISIQSESTISGLISLLSIHCKEKPIVPAFDLTYLVLKNSPAMVSIFASGGGIEIIARTLCEESISAIFRQTLINTLHIITEHHTENLSSIWDTNAINRLASFLLTTNDTDTLSNIVSTLKVVTTLNRACSCILNNEETIFKLLELSESTEQTKLSENAISLLYNLLKENDTNIGLLANKTIIEDRLFKLALNKDSLIISGNAAAILEIILIQSSKDIAELIDAKHINTLIAFATQNKCPQSSKMGTQVIAAILQGNTHLKAKLLKTPIVAVLIKIIRLNTSGNNALVAALLLTRLTAENPYTTKTIVRLNGTNSLFATAKRADKMTHVIYHLLDKMIAHCNETQIVELISIGYIDALAAITQQTPIDYPAAYNCADALNSLKKLASHFPKCIDRIIASNTMPILTEFIIKQESDQDTTIKALKSIKKDLQEAKNVILAMEADTFESLAMLLDHKNIDICINTIHVISTALHWHPECISKLSSESISDNLKIIVNHTNNPYLAADAIHLITQIMLCSQASIDDYCTEAFIRGLFHLVKGEYTPYLLNHLLKAIEVFVNKHPESIEIINQVGGTQFLINLTRSTSSQETEKSALNLLYMIASENKHQRNYLLSEDFLDINLKLLFIDVKSTSLNRGLFNLQQLYHYKRYNPQKLIEANGLGMLMAHGKKLLTFKEPQHVVHLKYLIEFLSQLLTKSPKSTIKIENNTSIDTLIESYLKTKTEDYGPRAADILDIFRAFIEQCPDFIKMTQGEKCVTFILEVLTDHHQNKPSEEVTSSALKLLQLIAIKIPTLSDDVAASGMEIIIKIALSDKSLAHAGQAAWLIHGLLTQGDKSVALSALSHDAFSALINLIGKHEFNLEAAAKAAFALNTLILKQPEISAEAASDQTVINLLSIANQTEVDLPSSAKATKTLCTLMLNQPQCKEIIRKHDGENIFQKMADSESYDFMAKQGSDALKLLSTKTITPTSTAFCGAGAPAGGDASVLTQPESPS